MNFGSAEKLLGSTGIIGVAGLSEQGREVRSSPKDLICSGLTSWGQHGSARGAPQTPYLWSPRRVQFDDAAASICQHGVEGKGPLKVGKEDG